MTIMFRRYSGFPPEIFERGIVRQMRGSALTLYMLLCRISDRKSSRRFEATDNELAKQAGISAKTISSARANLSKLRLVQCERLPGGTYTYELCDVDTGMPFPGDPRAKASYMKRAGAVVVSPPAPIKLFVMTGEASWLSAAAGAGLLHAG